MVQTTTGTTREKTWDEIFSFEDIVISKEKEIIAKLDFTFKCAHLRNVENFYFCGKDLSKQDEKIARGEEPHPLNKIYKRHLGLSELQIFCLDCYKNNCIYYKGENPEK